MKKVNAQNKGKSWIANLPVSAAGVLLVLTLLATTSDAAVQSVNASKIAATLQQELTPLLTGPVAGPTVIIPARPAPRSPFQPPSWIPNPPTPPGPPAVPPAPTWVPPTGARKR
ncbi:MAG: hypothetical protein ABFE01_29050 [Phycisphaerales bacterium]|jgi:hypothetical protein